MKNRKTISVGSVAVLLFAGVMIATPAHADKPEWAGKGGKSQGDRDNRGNGKPRDRDDRAGSRSHFGNQQQVIVRDYYAQEYRGASCPPGLARKNNGCMPPGQAKKWNKGRPLPRDVVYYDVPPQLVLRLGAPPAGHKYVRVAADILLIAVGTSMVVDAITDLGRM
jgi:Ni/Co efflux regulator RcnB